MANFAAFIVVASCCHFSKAIASCCMSIRLTAPGIAYCCLLISSPPSPPFVPCSRHGGVHGLLHGILQFSLLICHDCSGVLILLLPSSPSYYHLVVQPAHHSLSHQATEISYCHCSHAVNSLRFSIRQMAPPINFSAFIAAASYCHISSTIDSWHAPRSTLHCILLTTHLLGRNHY